VRRRRWLGTLGLLGTPALFLGGCGANGETAAAAEPTPAGEPWVVVEAGRATPSPQPSRGVAKPSPSAGGFLPFTPTSPTPAPSGSACDPTYPQALEINSASVVTGATSGTVTWWNPGGSDLVEYRLTAISQDLSAGPQRDVGWTVVTPGDSCGFLSATLTGLDRQTPYVFSVDAVTTVRGKDGTRAATVARSQPVSTN
jgi:hypothetical protein